MDFSQFILLLTLTALLYFYSINHKVRYFVKFTYYYVSVMVVSLVCMIIFIFRPKNPENLKVNFFMWRYLWKFFRLNFVLRNMHHLQSDRPYVLVSNHQSSIDVMMMAVMNPWRCSMLAKKELLYVFPFGPAAWLAGLIFVDRLNPERSRQTMADTSKLLIRENIPVVPLVVSSYSNFLSTEKKIFESGDVILEALPPVSTENMTADDVTELTEKVRQQMVPVFARVSREVKATYSLNKQD